MHFGADLTFPSEGSVICQHMPILKMAMFGFEVLQKGLECRGFYACQVRIFLRMPEGRDTHACN
jgi:hypothetical protein